MNLSISPKYALIRATTPLKNYINIQPEIDWGEYYESVERVLQSRWYKAAELYPSFAAHLMEKMSTIVVKQSQAAAKRARI